MKRIIETLSFFAFPASVLFAHLIAIQIFNLYYFLPNLDMPFHFIGGFSIAYTASKILSYFEDEKIIARLNEFVFLLLLFSLTAATAAFWEFAEFGMDRLLGSNVQVSLANTMQDQFLGICGGAAWALIYTLLRKTDRRDFQRKQSL